jgi:hypothetical protein
LINTARDFQKQWTADQCGTVMYKTMSKAGYEGWTLTKHDKWHAAKEASWDETKLDVNGFQAPGELRASDHYREMVPFSSLAVGVRVMPEGSDALDLTRMVRYSVQHAKEKWMYPRDYEKLLNLLGGPVPIHHGHHDRALFQRWEHMTPPPHRIWSDEEIKAAKDLIESEKKTIKADSMRSKTPFSGRQSREATSSEEGNRQTRTRPTKRMRLGKLDIDEEKVGGEEQLEVLRVQQYARAPTEYVAAPEDASIPPAAAINLAFSTESNVGETDPFSAYAFGGPRHRPPYRMLHDIEQPSPADVSGWAENLRWAFEQRACFWHAVQTERWNESPAHMEFIAQTRLKHLWTSEELFGRLPADEHERVPKGVQEMPWCE